jgi:hypothetical protein
MWRRRLAIFTSTVVRTKSHRVAVIVFVFFAVNLAWALVGNWSISFGGRRYSGNGHASRESGVYSCRGYLVIAIRNSFYVAGRELRATERGPEPILWNVPWSIMADMTVGPSMFSRRGVNGILDDRPRTIYPGLVINWQDSARGEWHNRGIAIHWVVLTALPAVVPVVSFVRRRKRVSQGLCAVCGYDLRATPDRCPECGTFNEL